MDILKAKRSMVVVVDIQEKLIGKTTHPDRVIQVAKRLMEFADYCEVPVTLTEQYPQGLGATTGALRAQFDLLKTQTHFFAKTAFGCGGDPEFAAMVQREDEVEQYVLCGIETHVCIMQTALQLINLGKQVHVCWDGVAARGQDYTTHGLQRLAQAGAVITNHESVAFEWMGTKDHPNFKLVSRIIREQLD